LSRHRSIYGCPPIATYAELPPWKKPSSKGNSGLLTPGLFASSASWAASLASVCETSRSIKLSEKNFSKIQDGLHREGEGVGQRAWFRAEAPPKRLIIPSPDEFSQERKDTCVVVSFSSFGGKYGQLSEAQPQIHYSPRSHRRLKKV